jgi:hypothetical protein
VAVLDDSAQGVLLLLEPAQVATTEHVSWIIRLYSRVGTTGPVLIAEQPLRKPEIQYGRVQTPLRFRMERSGNRLRTAFCASGQTWQYLSETEISSTTMQGGMFLNSGLGELETQVIFRDVEVQSAIRTNQ